MRLLKVDLSNSNLRTRSSLAPDIDLHPAFVFTPDPDLAKAIVAMGEMSDYRELEEELPCTLVSILLFGLVAKEDETMRAFERMSVHYRNPWNDNYSEFWNAFQALQYVFMKRYHNNHALIDMVRDHLPQDCNYCEEGVLHVRRSRSGRHYLIG